MTERRDGERIKERKRVREDMKEKDRRTVRTGSQGRAAGALDPAVGTTSWDAVYHQFALCILMIILLNIVAKAVLQTPL